MNRSPRLGYFLCFFGVFPLWVFAEPLQPNSAWMYRENVIHAFSAVTNHNFPHSDHLLLQQRLVGDDWIEAVDANHRPTAVRRISWEHLETNGAGIRTRSDGNALAFALKRGPHGWLLRPDGEKQAGFKPVQTDRTLFTWLGIDTRALSQAITDTGGLPTGVLAEQLKNGLLRFVDADARPEAAFAFDKLEETEHEIELVFSAAYKTEQTIRGVLGRYDVTVKGRIQLRKNGKPPREIEVVSDFMPSFKGAYSGTQTLRAGWDPRPAFEPGPTPVSAEKLEQMLAVSGVNTWLRVFDDETARLRDGIAKQLKGKKRRSQFARLTEARFGAEPLRQALVTRLQERLSARQADALLARWATLPAAATVYEYRPARQKRRRKSFTPAPDPVLDTLERQFLLQRLLTGQRMDRAYHYWAAYQQQVAQEAYRVLQATASEPEQALIDPLNLLNQEEFKQKRDAVLLGHLARAWHPVPMAEMEAWSAFHESALGTWWARLVETTLVEVAAQQAAAFEGNPRNRR